MKDFDSKLTAFFESIDSRFAEYLPNMVAETAVEVFKDSFRTKSFDGNPWPAYGSRKEPKRGSLMQRTNNLASSIRPTLVSPAKVTISAGNSRVKYARVHNEGLRVKGTWKINPYINNNFMGKGKRVKIKAHSRKVDFKMPQRQFAGKSEILLNTIKNRFKTSFKTF